MKKLKVLKSLTNILWSISAIFIFFIVIGTILMFFMGEKGNFSVLGVSLKPAENMIATIFKAVFMISYMLIFFSIDNFKKLIDEFLEKKEFTSLTVTYLKNIGSFMMIAGIVMIIARIGFYIFSDNKTGFGFGYVIHFLCIAFGLFFLVLSEIFNISRALKEENDLTI